MVHLAASTEEHEAPVDHDTIMGPFAPGDQDAPVVHEHPEDPVGVLVRLLLAEMFPDGFGRTRHP